MGLCKMFGCLPSALYAEDASVFRLLKIAALGGGLDGDADGQ